MRLEAVMAERKGTKASGVSLSFIRLWNVPPA